MRKSQLHARYFLRVYIKPNYTGGVHVVLELINKKRLHRLHVIMDIYAREYIPLNYTPFLFSMRTPKKIFFVKATFVLNSRFHTKQNEFINHK